MLITERVLRSLVRRILREGASEDAKALEGRLKDNPGALELLQSLSSKPKWVKWLADRYLQKKYPIVDKLPDVLPLIVDFASKDVAIKTKYTSSKKFRVAVDDAFPPEGRGWQNPSDVTKMPSSDMSALLALFDSSKEVIDVDRADKSWKQDKIGQIGTWALYFPSNQQNSINIAGADPRTRLGYTTWCTARTAGSNLFYNYIARGIMLFYAIDESKLPTDAKSRISLGYIQGELNASGEHGGVTVDAQNNGLKMPDLQQIFGGHLSGILAAAKAVVARHDGIHPGKSEIDEAARDPEKFVKMLHGLSRDESDDLAKHIIGKGTSPEVLAVAGRHKNVRIRALAASKQATPPEVLTQLASDPDKNVVFYVAGNASTPLEALIMIAKGDDYTAKMQIARTPRSREQLPAFKILARDKEIDVRRAVAVNEDIPTEVIDMMVEMLTTPSTREGREALRSDIDACLASHQNISAGALRKLYDYQVKIKNLGHRDNIFEVIALSKNVDAGTLDQIAKNSEASKAWLRVARNPNTETNTLLYMANNKAASARTKIEVENNKNATEAVRLSLATDEDDTVRYYVARSDHATPDVIRALYNTAKSMRKLGQLDSLARNPKTPSDILEKLADIPEIDMTDIIDHPNVSDEVLEKLSRSSNPKYARDAETMLFWRRERSRSREIRAGLRESSNESASRQARYIVSRLRRNAGEF